MKSVDKLAFFLAFPMKRLTMTQVPHETGSGNVFVVLGFTPADASGLRARTTLIVAIKDAIARRKLTQQEAARLCGTDQPIQSKVFRSCMDGVTIHRLAARLSALGQDVEVTIKPPPPAS